MVFHWSLSDSKSPQVSRTRLGILAVLSYAVVWIVSTRPPTSKSSRPFNNSLVIVPNTPVTIGTIVTFMFHSFSILYQGRGTYPSFHFPSDLFCGPPGQQSRQFCRFSFFVDYYEIWSSGRIIIIIIIIIYSFRVFHVSVCWWSFIGVWVTVSSSLQNSSQYSSRSQQCCSLDGLHSSSNFQVLQSF